MLFKASSILQVLEFKMYSIKHIPISITNNAPLSILVLSPDDF